MYFIKIILALQFYIRSSKMHCYKNGILKVYWDDSLDVERSSYEGLTDDEFALLLADPEVKVLEHTEYEIDNEEALAEAQKFIMDRGMPGDVKSSGKLHDVVVNRMNKKVR